MIEESTKSDVVRVFDIHTQKFCGAYRDGIKLSKEQLESEEFDTRHPSTYSTPGRLVLLGYLGYLGYHCWKKGLVGSVTENVSPNNSIEAAGGQA